jgi:transcriptional/translational regulatory protein YebC/TACO1
VSVQRRLELFTTTYIEGDGHELASGGDPMDTVTWVGVVMGSLLILTAIAIALMKKAFPKGAFGFLVFGLVLISFSKWGEIKITTKSIDLLRDQVKETAAAAGEVAAQARQTATAVQATQSEVRSVTDALERSRVLPANVTGPIRTRISVIPKIDVAKLDSARRVLARVRAQ